MFRNNAFILNEEDKVFLAHVKEDDVCCNCQVPLKLHVAYSVAHEYLS